MFFLWFYLWNDASGCSITHKSIENNKNVNWFMYDIDNKDDTHIEYVSQ